MEIKNTNHTDKYNNYQPRPTLPEEKRKKQSRVAIIKKEKKMKRDKKIRKISSTEYSHWRNTETSHTTPMTKEKGPLDPVSKSIKPYTPSPPSIEGLTAILLILMAIVRNRTIKKKMQVTTFRSKTKKRQNSENSHSFKTRRKMSRITRNMSFLSKIGDSKKSKRRVEGKGINMNRKALIRKKNIKRKRAERTIKKILQQSQTPENNGLISNTLSILGSICIITCGIIRRIGKHRRGSTPHQTTWRRITPKLLLTIIIILAWSSTVGSVKISSTNVGSDISKRWVTLNNEMIRNKVDIACYQETRIPSREEITLQTSSPSHRLYGCHNLREHSIAIW
jgi:hypothetical protein